MFENRVNLNELQEGVEKIKQELGKIIVGQDRMIELMITAILANGHVLIEGVPGIAKTLTSKLMARCISTGFSRIQFTPDLMPSDILGTSILNIKTSEFEFRKGPIFSNIILIDEINRAPAKTQAALFEVMEERQITLDGKRYEMSSPFIVLATQNPIDQEGTYRLPEAQLDRFLFKIVVTYPELEQEIKILTYFHQQKGQHIDSIQAVLTPEKMEDYRVKIKSLHIEPHLIQYIAQIVNQTRSNRDLFLGASPRASLSILNASKAFAAIHGRDFVSPEDIKEIAPAVLNHRIILTPEKEMEGATPESVIKQLVDKVEVPR